MLTIEYLLTKIGVDTAENEPPKVRRQAFSFFNLLLSPSTTTTAHATADLSAGRGHELARVHALHGDEYLLVDLVAVLVAEVDLRERRPTTRVVDDLLDQALHVPGLRIRTPESVEI